MQTRSTTFADDKQITQSNRLYYLDWLRIIAVLFVFLHHCAKFFDFDEKGIGIYSSVRSLPLSMLREFDNQWMMPLFFIISGASIYFSLNSRKIGGFIKERVLRILIPLVFIGTFLINPPQVYLRLLFNGATTSSFIQWYPNYFKLMHDIGSSSFVLLGTHLWYLHSLFFYSLILLPLFIPSKKTGKSAISSLSLFFQNPWALFLLFVPLSITSAVSEIMGIGATRIMGGWDPMSYVVFFIYGYLIFSNTQIRETIRKYYAVNLGVAIVLSIVYLDSHFGINLDISGITGHNINENGAILPVTPFVFIGIQAFRGLLSWCLIIGLLGFGHRFLNGSNRFLAYTNEAVLPFYILHLTIIFIFCFYIIQWDSSIFTKFFAMACISFVVIMAIYELLVRRLNILRFLFGMKLKKSRTT